MLNALLSQIPIVNLHGCGYQAVTNWRRFRGTGSGNMASVVVEQSACRRSFTYPQQSLLRLTRTIRGVNLSNIEYQLSNIKLSSRTYVVMSMLFISTPTRNPRKS